MTKTIPEWIAFFESDELGGPTGAMYGAAKQLAWNWCYDGGPRGLLEQVEAERHLQCARDYLKA